MLRTLIKTTKLQKISETQYQFAKYLEKKKERKAVQMCC